MKLHISQTSPYARKCRVLILEMGLENRIDVVDNPPLDDPANLLEINPLGKVPVLEREDACTIIGSANICEYLDSLDSEPWIPSSGESRIKVLRQQALADGLLDLTVGRRIEMTREDHLRFDFWTDRWQRGIQRTIHHLEDERRQYERSVDLGALSIAIALGYLDFRYAEYNWRSDAPGLSDFYDRWNQRDSFIQTRPPEDG